MPRSLKSTGQAVDLVFALTFDDDNTTLKEFVDPDVNDSMVIDPDVDFGTTTFKGQTRGYLETFADGGFSFDGVSFDGGPNVQAIGPAASELSIVMLCAGSGVGNSNKFWVSFNGDVNGLGTDGSGKAIIDFGGGGCSGTTTISTNGTTKFFVAGNWQGPGVGNSEIFYVAEAGSTVASENTEHQGDFGSDLPLTHIGGPPGNGNLPAKIIALYVFDGVRTQPQLQSLFEDDLDELFGVAEPGSIDDTAARFSGGSTNGSPDASIGGVESSREILSGIRNNLFDPITTSQASGGHTDYRCFYLHADPDGDLATFTLWIHDNADESHTTFAVGLDGDPGDTAVTPANETTAPSGVTFSTPTSGAPLTLTGPLTANNKQAVWIRRTVTSGAAFTAMDGMTIRASDGTNTKDFTFRHNIQLTEARVWAAIGTNTMADQDPCPSNACAFSGSGGQDDIMESNGGGCLQQIGNTLKLLIWGGGHGDYAGNEVYAFDLVTKQWSALTSPSTPSGGSEASGKYGDGLPRSTHTYSYLEYDPDNDAMFVSSIPVTYPNAQTSFQAFNFELASNSWDLSLPSGGPANPIGGSVGGGNVGVTCYVTGRGKIWYQPASSRDNYALWDTGTLTWGDFQAGSGTHRGARVAVYDSRRHKVYGIGDMASSNIAIWDLHAGTNSTLQATTGTNAATITAAITVGAIYDELLDCVIAWNGGQTLHVLNLSTFVWSTLSVSGSTPSSPQAQGTYGRFRYIKACSQFPAGGYVVVNDNNQSVYLFATEVSPSVTVTLTGNSATASRGTLAITGASRLSLGGLGSTASNGAIVATGGASGAPTGVASSGAVGAFSFSTSAVTPLTGNAGTGAAGSVSPAASSLTAVAGTQGSGAAGSISTQGAAASPLTGVAGAGAAGDIVFGGGVIVSLSGNSASGAVGTLTELTGAIVLLSGQQALAEVGSLSITGKALLQITGVTATGSQGQILALVESGAVALLGLAATGQVGSVTVRSASLADLVGVSGAGQLGSLVALTQITLSISGHTANGQAGMLTITGDAVTDLQGTAGISGLGFVLARGKEFEAPQSRTFKIALRPRSIDIKIG